MKRLLHHSRPSSSNIVFSAVVVSYMPVKLLHMYCIHDAILVCNEMLHIEVPSCISTINKFLHSPELDHLNLELPNFQINIVTQSAIRHHTRPNILNGLSDCS